MSETSPDAASTSPDAASKSGPEKRVHASSTAGSTAKPVRGASTSTGHRKKLSHKFSGARRRMHPVFIVWITAMWCILMGELTIANLVSGALVGTFIVFSLPLPAMPITGMHINWLKLITNQLIWVVELIQASFKVAWLALRPAPPPKTAIIEVPMRVDSELILAYAVGLYNLQPGGTVTDIDIANRMLTIHVLDGDDESDIEWEIAAVAKLEKRMIETFELGHQRRMS